MKSRILFVAENMNMNGANKSLINLLSTIDTEKYYVDIFLYEHSGLLIELIPASIHLLPENQYMRFFETDIRTALKEAPLFIKLIRIFAALLRKKKNYNLKYFKEKIWKYVPILQQEYDLAVGYCEGSTHSFILQKVNAKKKIGWIHISINDQNNEIKWQLDMCQKLSQVIVVSEDSKEALLQRDISDEKIKVIHNIMSPCQIRKYANEKYELNIPVNSKLIVTIGRLSYQKGIDIILDTVQYLVDRGVGIRWIVIGDGNADYYMAATKERDIDNFVQFIGGVINPYAIVRQCDVYVQPSRFEGWGMAITEAKILAKPIIVSDIDVFKEQLVDGVNGLIRPLNAKEIGDAILQVFQDEQLVMRMRDNLLKEQLGNEEEVKKLYELVNSKSKDKCDNSSL